MIIDLASLEDLPKEMKRYYLRLNIALTILPHLLASKGSKTDKVWASVGYADDLLARLDSTTLEPNNG